MLIQINAPGRPYHRQTVEADPEILEVFLAGRQGEYQCQVWDAQPTGNPNRYAVECFVAMVPGFGRIAIPRTKAVEIGVAA